MTREIKFRRWDTDEKYMYYDKPFHLSTDINRYIVMQFTGLHDKNGKEVYQKDIIRRYFSRDRDDFWVGELVDANIYGHAALGRTFKGKTTIFHEIISSDEIEVIGNVFENPELLNEKEK